MINLFAGYESRESPGFHCFVHSVLSRARQPVNIIPLARMGLPAGTNSFTLSRFLVPYLMRYEGHAIFADASDQLMLADVGELDALFDETKAVQVVKHPNYISLHQRKYVGTQMETEQSNYPRKNWASLMIVNCEHPAWRLIYCHSIAAAQPLELLQLSHIKDEDIGDLPAAWNVLLDEGQDDTGAKLLHWSSGIPYFRHYQGARRALDWVAEYEAMSGRRVDG